MEETKNARTLGGRLGWLVMQATLDSNMGGVNPPGYGGPASSNGFRNEEPS
ncbi:MAG: hypothetical protein AABY61_15200 [Nitrospirota bacterium]|jgi:hypothetical protein